MRRRSDRVAMNLPVELITGGKRLRAVSQDVSPYGMFVRLPSPLPVGAVVQIVISPNGQRLVTTGQVSHALGEVRGAHPRPVPDLDASITQLLLEHARRRDEATR